MDFIAVSKNAALSIKTRREALRLSIATISERFGVNQATWYRWEGKGVADPLLDLAMQRLELEHAALPLLDQARKRKPHAGHPLTPATTQQLGKPILAWLDDGTCITGTPMEERKGWIGERVFVYDSSVNGWLFGALKDPPNFLAGVRLEHVPDPLPQWMLDVCAKENLPIPKTDQRLLDRERLQREPRQQYRDPRHYTADGAPIMLAALGTVYTDPLDVRAAAIAEEE